MKRASIITMVLVCVAVLFLVPGDAAQPNLNLTDAEFNNYQRISRLNAEVRQKKIRAIVDYMDRTGIRYCKYHDVDQRYIYLPYSPYDFTMTDDRVQGSGKSMQLGVSFQPSRPAQKTGLPPGETGVIFFGTMRGNAALSNRLFDITGHTVAGMMVKPDQQEGVIYHFPTSLDTMGHPIKEIRVYQGGTMNGGNTYVVPVHGSLGKVSDEVRREFFNLIEQLRQRM